MDAEENISDRIENRNLKWFGHMLRMDEKKNGLNHEWVETQHK